MYKPGEEIRGYLAGQEAKTDVPAYELIPGLRRIIGEGLYGMVWSRRGLDIRYRCVSTVTVLALLHQWSQFRMYLDYSLSVGMKPEELLEVLLQLGFYNGFGNTFQAAEIAGEVFRSRGLKLTRPEGSEPSIEEMEALGRKWRDSFGGSAPTPGYLNAVGSLAPDLHRLMFIYGYGNVYQRPELDRKARLVCALSSFIALRVEQQFSTFTTAVLRSDFTKDEIVELVMHCAFYVGIPAAVNALGVAAKVFQQADAMGDN